MAFCAVGWGYTHAAALAEHGPDAVVQTMDELAAALTSGG
jgi:phosphoglycolate phosphatase-like HAD superfamily hydrolase